MAPTLRTLTPSRMPHRLLVLALAGLAGCAGATAQRSGDGAAEGAASGPEEGQRVSEGFEATTIDGERFALGEHLGEDVILMNFWATWCEPCKTEMPFLQDLHEEYADDGLVVLSVSTDSPQSASKVKPYVHSKGYTFPVVIDRDTSIVNAYNPAASVPYTVIIDRNGKVVKTIEGFRLAETDRLERRVAELVGVEPEDG